MGHNRAGILLTGTAATAAAGVVSQISVIAVSPVLSRTFSTEELGLYAAVSALSLLVGTVSGLRIEAAITTESTEDQAAAALLASQLASIVITSILASVLVLISAAGALPVANYAAVIACGAVSSVAFAGTQALSQLALRHRAYKPVASARVAQAVTQAALQVGAGIAGCGALGLVVGELAGRLAGLAVSLSLVANGTVSRAFSRRAIRASWVRTTGFRTTLLGATVLNAAAYHALPIGFALAFDARVVGLFYMAYRAVVLPIGFIGSALAQVLGAEAAHSVRSAERFDNMALQFGAHAIWLSAPLIAVLLFFGPDLAGFVFGEPWRESGEMMRILAPMALLYSAASPLSSLLIVGRRFGEGVAVGALDLLAKVLACLAGWTLQSPLLATAFVAGGGTILCAYSIRRFLAVADASATDLARSTVPAALLALATAGPAMLVHRLWGGWAWIAAALLGGVLYFGVYAWRHLTILGGRLALR